MHLSTLQFDKAMARSNVREQDLPKNTEIRRRVYKRGDKSSDCTVARELAGRATVMDSSAEWWMETKDRFDTFQGVTKYYRNNRRVMAPPHPELTREQASIFRQLQTNSLLTPVIMRHISPELYPDDTCVLCNNARATAAHLLWDCEVRPVEASTRTDLPPWYQDVTRSYSKEDQLSAVQQILSALERQHRSESCGAPSSLRGRGRPPLQ